MGVIHDNAMQWIGGKHKEEEVGKDKEATSTISEEETHRNKDEEDEATWKH